MGNAKMFGLDMTGLKFKDTTQMSIGTDDLNITERRLIRGGGDSTQREESIFGKGD